jgi:hypothetical protein
MQTAKNLQINKMPPQSVTAGTLPCLPLLKISLLEQGALLSTDALLQMEYGNQRFTFAAEYKTNWQERAFQDALGVVKKYPSGNGEALPLVILPYLSEKHLDALAEEKISGLDFCGNCLIIVPNQLLIRQSGKPNRFQIEQSLRNPYQGKAALVGRILLQNRTFKRLEDLHQEIIRRGGDISLALVSRVVQRLEEDVIVTHSKEYKVRLVQPEKLIDALADAHDSKKAKLVWRGKMPAIASPLPSLFTLAKEHYFRIALTGIGSATRHASLAMEPMARLFMESTENAENLLVEWGAIPAEQFTNLEIYSAPDSTCFFDSETDSTSIVWASPLHTYIEMMNSGDIRLKESAAPIRERLLKQGNLEREGDE